MSSHSTSLELKSQLTINLDPRCEFPSSPSEENKKKKKEFPIKDRKKTKRKKKVPGQRSKENKGKKIKSLIKDRKKMKEAYKKSSDQANIQTIQNCHKQIRKERKPQLEVVISH